MTYIEERMYFPDECDPDDDDAHSFGIQVTWRGRGKWAVFHGSKHAQLSSAGNWLYHPLKMTQMKHCRFTFEDACALAEKHRNDVKVNGETWAEWEAYKSILNGRK